MDRIGRVRRWPAISAAVLALLVALVGTAIAESGPATTSVSIVKISKRALARANKAIRIARKTSKQSGPKGDTGVQGPKGNTGSQGPPGVSGLQTVGAASEENSENSKIVGVSCPPGKRVFGGGAAVEGPAFASVAIDLNSPGSDTSWFAAAHEHDETPDDWELQVYAICGNAG